VLAKYLMVILDSRPTLREQVEIKVKKDHSLLWILWHDLGLETKNGSLALYLYHLAIHPLCISSLAWLPDSQCQKGAK